MSEHKYCGDAANFIDMGNVLYHDPSAELMIRAGQIFEAKTVKGGKNLIVAMRVVDGWMVYLHGDKAKKVSMFQFVNAVMGGELEPKMPTQVDVGRMSMAAIGIDAVANRRTAEERIDEIEEQAIARLQRGGAIQ